MKYQSAESIHQIEALIDGEWRPVLGTATPTLADVQGWLEVYLKADRLPGCPDVRINPLWLAAAPPSNG